MSSNNNADEKEVDADENINQKAATAEDEADDGVMDDKDKQQKASTDEPEADDADVAMEEEEAETTDVADETTPSEGRDE